MIISRIIGGLGNQMFCYAAGRALALRRQTKYKLDTQDYQFYKLHRYSLPYLQISAPQANPTEIAPFRPQKKTVFKNLLGKLSGSSTPSGYIKEASLRFNPAVAARTDDPLYLDGYWQSEKYFSDYADTIRKEFQPKNAPTGRNVEMLTNILSVQSVCLHIRRGDYVTNTQTNQIHGTADLAYYYKAIAAMKSTSPQMQLFIFSDDPEWVKENLKTEIPKTYIDFNGPEKNYEDLRLMSACRHHIIANSSFSWWGAWLGKKPGQRVFAPKQWFKNAELDATDLVPERWERL